MIIWERGSRPTIWLPSKAVLGEVDTLSITTSALRDATALGFDRAGIAKVIRSTKPGMFYKSMTTRRSPRLAGCLSRLP